MRARRDEILQFAAELFVLNGYKATTVRAIADASGILSGSLYHHFDTKDDMLDELLQRYMGPALKSYQDVVKAGRDPRETLKRLIEAAWQPVLEHRAALLLLQQEGKQLAKLDRFAYINDISDEIEKLWRKVIRSGIKSDVFNAETDLIIPYHIVRDSVVSAARWFDPKGRLSLSELTNQYVTIILAGVARA